MASPVASASTSHLSYPAPDAPEASADAAPDASDAPRAVLADRLYIGNLHPSVDEYTLLTAFSRFGRVTKLDFLFHKAGSLRGKPRGYAFIEYGSPEDARRALAAHDRPLRGRLLVVTPAHQAPPAAAAPRRRIPAARPTALSLLKGAPTRDGTTDKIALLEEKLRQMERATVPAAPGLPLRPASTATASSSTGPIRTRPARPAPVLPALPIRPATEPTAQKAQASSLTLLSHAHAPAAGPSQRTSGGLPGVKIKRAKERDKQSTVALADAAG